MASLGGSIAKVGGNTLLSRILGFLRDLVIARLFGADAATDAFFVAFRIPNALRRLFAEGALAMALVPILLEHKRRGGQPAVRAFLDDAAGTLTVGLLTVTGLGILIAPALVLLFAPGFAQDPDQWDLTTQMLRLTFPYVLLISLAALAGAALNTYERFGVPAFTPVLLNLSLIGCAIYLAPRLERPILALALGVLLGGVVQLAFQLPFLARLGLLPKPRINPGNPGVRRTLGLMGPVVLGSSAGQINLLLGTVLASFLTTGSISWLYYSDRLMELPIGILGAALGTVILPRLSQHHTAGEPEAFSRTLDWALRWLLLIGLPAAVGLVVLAGPIVATLFHSAVPGSLSAGAFDAQDVRMTGHSLAAYAGGLLGFLGVRVLAPAYFARQEMRAPVRAALVTVAVNALLSLALMGPLGHLGLALATSLAAWANAALLWMGLRRGGAYRPTSGWRSFISQALAAVLAMGLLLHLGSGDLASWIALAPGQRAIQLIAWILAGTCVYALVLLLTGLRPRHLREQPG
ncbi:MAG: murein biosynthesis integral membrane protein MurJ [Bdellovibrio bacteriovorus]